MTPEYTYSSIGTFYWVFPDNNPWSLSLLDEPQPNDMCIKDKPNGKMH